VASQHQRKSINGVGPDVSFQPGPSILPGDCRIHRDTRHRPFQSNRHVGMDVSRFGASKTRWTVRRAAVRGYDR